MKMLLGPERVCLTLLVALLWLQHVEREKRQPPFPRNLRATQDKEVKKAIGLFRKTTNSHVHRSFFVHFFAVTARLRRENA